MLGWSAGGQQDGIVNFCLSIMEASTQRSQAGCQYMARMLRLACIVCLHSQPLYEQVRPDCAVLCIV